MTARLHLARAAEVGRVDGEPSERIAARHDFVVREDRAELEGKSIERARELVGREDQRRGESTLVPERDARRTRTQIGRPQIIDDGHCRDRCVGMTACAVHDERLHTRVEDRA